MLMVNFYGFSCRDEYADCTALLENEELMLGALSEKSRLIVAVA